MINAVGRRKASISRVYLTKGDGKVSINGKSLEDYFPQKHIQHALLDPFKTVDAEKIYDLKVNVKGGQDLSQCPLCWHAAFNQMGGCHGLVHSLVTFSAVTRAITAMDASILGALGDDQPELGGNDIQTC